MKDIKYFKIILKYLKDEKKYIVLLLINQILFNIFPLISSVSWSKIIENLSSNQQFNFMLFLIIYGLSSILAWALFPLIDGLIYNRLERKFIANGQKDLYKKIINLPAIAYEDMGVGELNNRLNNDLERIISLLNRIIKLISRLIASVICTIIVFFISWVIGIEMLVICAIMYVLANVYYPKIKKIQEEISKDGDKFAKYATEDFNGIREIKALGIKRNVELRIGKLIESYSNKQKNINKTEEIYYAINNFAYFSLYAVIVFTGGLMVFNNTLQLTMFFIIISVFNRVEIVVEEMSDFGINYNKVIVSLKRVDEILNNKKYEDEKFGNIDLVANKITIEFKDVKFKYRKDEKYTLKDLSIKLVPNKKIAIVGKSGQGKSTLFNLLMRYFDVNKGMITVNDIDIKDLTEKSLRDNLSIIRQSPYLFNQSIIDNFKMVKEDATLEEIREVCKKAYIDKYIMSLPKKYNTIIGEGGINLSGGQKQRLAIARTLLKNTGVILFDEATSALDNESQEYIKQTIDDLVKDHTIVIVAHRLSTIMDADIIYLIDDGQVLEHGTHKQLMRKSKLYKRLYSPELSNDDVFNY